MFNPRVFVAEFIGTFALVFVGAASGMYQVGVLGVALAHGLTLAAMVYIFGHVSGAHINPAVTLGLAANGSIKWLDALVYWVAQLSGAALAAFLLRTFVSLIEPTAFTAASTNGVLVTAENQYYAMGLEALLTFFLVTAVLHTAVDGKAGPFAGWAIGTTLTVAIMAGGPLTGASLNPARSFGPAIFNSVLDVSKLDFQNPMFYLVFFMGPFIGSVLAVVVHQLFRVDADLEEDEAEVEAEVIIVEEAPVVVEEKPAKKPARKTSPRKSTKKQE